jgi:hypothetical protein
MTKMTPAKKRKLAGIGVLVLGLLLVSQKSYSLILMLLTAQYALEMPATLVQIIGFLLIVLAGLEILIKKHFSFFLLSLSLIVISLSSWIDANSSQDYFTLLMGSIGLLIHFRLPKEKRYFNEE